VNASEIRAEASRRLVACLSQGGTITGEDLADALGDLLPTGVQEAVTPDADLGHSLANPLRDSASAPGLTDACCASGVNDSIRIVAAHGQLSPLRHGSCRYEVRHP
jgi:hypothetical protein